MKAIISLWAPGFNGADEEGRKLEAIVEEKEVIGFLDTLHYPDEAIEVQDTALPVTHIPNQDGFRRIIY